MEAEGERASSSQTPAPEPVVQTTPVPEPVVQTTPVPAPVVQTTPVHYNMDQTKAGGTAQAECPALTETTESIETIEGAALAPTQMLDTEAEIEHVRSPSSQISECANREEDIESDSMAATDTLHTDSRSEPVQQGSSECKVICSESVGEGGRVAALEGEGASVGDGTESDSIEDEYMIPQREILLPDEIETVWERSQAYGDLLGFIAAMSEAIKGKKLCDEHYVSPTIANLVKVLDVLDAYVDETPPVEEPQRFGNTAFRDWFQRLTMNCEGLVQDALPSKYHNAVPEISVYLRESCGNSTRIDYGTGHEMAFLAFLCCLYKLGALTEQDTVATVFTLFNRYLTLIRRLQQTYRMEPAGSHGVWNLDDYHFVPFIWGSAQLIEHSRLKPKHYPDPEMCVSFSKDYMLFAAVQYIHQVKTGPFHEHSNQLWNISGVKLWSKVHTGLIKMYRAEVLNKFPVIQHFLFGSIMSVDPV